MLKLVFIVFSFFVINLSNAAVLTVGSGKEFIFPSIAAEYAKDGDVIEIDADGFYLGDEAVWKASNLLIRGVNGRPVIQSAGLLANNKALWVISGNNVTVENMEFTGAKVRDQNGAGIRHEGAGLTVRNCYFHQNQNGILTGENLMSDIFISESEFALNGSGRGQTHNVYIGHVRSLIFEKNYSHHAIVGHTLKTRAEKNIIRYNRLMDEDSGNSSYLVDVPNGGETYIVGNIIQQGKFNDNRTLIAYGQEGQKNKNNQLFVAYNTFVNNDTSGQFIRADRGGRGQIVNNIFAGRGNVVNGPLFEQKNNYRIQELNIFINTSRFNYRIIDDASVRDKAIFLFKGFGEYGIPAFQLEQATVTKRERIGKNYDIGAHEYQ